MNIEAYNYTVITTILGMLVVFLSLTALSLLMVGLKASFGERPPGGRSAGKEPRTGKKRAGGRPARPQRAPSRAGGVQPGAAASAGPAAGSRVEASGGEDREPPPWLAAAVAAYLAGEEGRGPTAEPWFPEFNHFDPWLGSGRTARRPEGGRAEQGA